MLNETMSIVTKLYFPVLMPFVLFLMSIYLSDHVITIVKYIFGSKR